MQKSNTVYMYCISFCFFATVVIYTFIHSFVSLSPVLPTEALSNLLGYNTSHDRHVTSLSSVDGDGEHIKNIRIYDIYRSCNMSFLWKSHALPFQCLHLMTLAQSIGRGRTGNQMFQYAALLGVAYRHNYTAVISPKFPLIKAFNLPNILGINTTEMIHLKEDKPITYDRKFENIDTKHNYTLDGYLQSWRYFSEINNTIRNIYKVKDIYLKPAVNFLRRINRQGRSNVCVHVRRGDMLHDQRRGFSVAGLGYINKAMSYFNTKLNDPLFIVLSDDKRWCKSNLNRNNTVISPFNKVYEDLALMTLCDHAIITSGTFGWWGAWLSNGNVVYYKDYPRPNSWLRTQFDLHDYYPPSWVGLA